MSDRLIVLNKDADTISLVDPETGETERTIETDFNPHEVAVGPDGERVYVTCSLGGSLIVYDAETWEREETITHEDFDFPHGLGVRESADELWLASTYSNRVFVFDLSTHELLANVRTHREKSHMVSIGPDQERAFIANIGSDDVTVFDADSREIIDHVDVGGGPEGIEAMDDYVLVANQDDSRLSVVDNDELDDVNMALLGETPIRVVPQPAGDYVFVPNRESNDVSVIDTEHVRNGEQRPWEIARIPVGRWPGGTVFAPSGETAFVANNKTNDISVIDVDTFQEVDRYDVGIHPDGIAYLER